MNQTHTEGIITNLIRNIKEECSSKNQDVTESLVAFMVKAAVLDSSNNFSLDQDLTDDDFDRLAQICCRKLLSDDSLSLTTAKMQIFFDEHYSEKDEYLKEHNEVMEARMLTIASDIVESKANTDEESAALYRKIVSFSVLRSGLGNPTDVRVIREATAALQSILPQTEVRAFVALKKAEKQRQLDELTLIVTGVRLFNREIGKGGAAIDDVPAELNENLRNFRQKLQSELERTQKSSEINTILIEDELMDGELLRQASLNNCQYRQYLRVIQKDVECSNENCDDLADGLQKRLSQLRKTVSSRSAIPTGQVYPQFVELARIWKNLQDALSILAVWNNLLSQLRSFSEVEESLLPMAAREAALLGRKIETESERKARNGKLRVESTSGNWLFPNESNNFEQLPLQYQGFCAFSLGELDRVLLPGLPEIGIFSYKNLLYTFSSREKALKFASDPDSYLGKIVECARRSPDMIGLLSLDLDFVDILPRAKQGKAGEEIVQKTEVETQTETHPLPARKDVNYEWNEWQLRRKALKLANLRQMATRSVQSKLSGMRRDNETQVYLPRDKETQSRRQLATNTERSLVYLAGLKGTGLGKSSVLRRVELSISNNGD